MDYLIKNFQQFICCNTSATLEKIVKITLKCLQFLIVSIKNIKQTQNSYTVGVIQPEPTWLVVSVGNRVNKSFPNHGGLAKFRKSVHFVPSVASNRHPVGGRLAELS